MDAMIALVALGQVEQQMSLDIGNSRLFQPQLYARFERRIALEDREIARFGFESNDLASVRHHPLCNCRVPADVRSKVDEQAIVCKQAPHDLGLERFPGAVCTNLARYVVVTIAVNAKREARDTLYVDQSLRRGVG